MCNEYLYVKQIDIIIMKVADLKVGMIVKEDRFEAEVVGVNETTFELQYPSGACLTFWQESLDNGSVKTFIG